MNVISGITFSLVLTFWESHNYYTVQGVIICCSYYCPFLASYCFLMEFVHDARFSRTLFSPRPERRILCSYLSIPLTGHPEVTVCHSKKRRWESFALRAIRSGGRPNRKQCYGMSGEGGGELRVLGCILCGQPLAVN